MYSVSCRLLDCAETTDAGAVAANESEIGAYLTPPKINDGEVQSLAAMKAMKALVAEFGSERVKRIADLRG